MWLHSVLVLLLTPRNPCSVCCSSRRDLVATHNFFCSQIVDHCIDDLSWRQRRPCVVEVQNVFAASGIASDLHYVDGGLGGASSHALNLARLPRIGSSRFARSPTPGGVALVHISCLRAAHRTSMTGVIQYKSEPIATRNF